MVNDFWYHNDIPCCLLFAHMLLLCRVQILSRCFVPLVEHIFTPINASMMMYMRCFLFSDSWCRRRIWYWSGAGHTVRRCTWPSSTSAWPGRTTPWDSWWSRCVWNGLYCRDPIVENDNLRCYATHHRFSKMRKIWLEQTTQHPLLIGWLIRWLEHWLIRWSVDRLIHILMDW